jgi:hypothetical protein
LNFKEGNMPKNVGLIDRIVRFILFIAFAVFGILNISTGLWWVGLFGLIFLVTGVAGYCPIWHAFGVKTISVKKL